MHRRRFLQLTAGMGASALSLSLVGPILARASSSKYKHWAWTHARADESPQQWAAKVRELRQAGISAALIGGATGEVCRIAREEGLEPHAWTWTMCRGGEDLLTNHPQWYVVSREGKSAADQPPYVPYYHFLCPSRPEVRQYLAEEFGRIAATSGLAGAHLDYVRYPDVILPRALWERYDLVQHQELPPFDYCYCDVCRESFKQQSGIDPLEIDDPTASAQWRAYRWDSISRAVDQIVAAIAQQGKQATAAVFPSPTIARRLVRQDWATWPLDAVLPMVYHSFYNEKVDWIEPTVREGVDALPADKPLYAGLYLPAMKEEGDFERAVQGALNGGAKGVALFGGVRSISAR